MINCPYCGKLTDPKLDGCPHCGGFLKKKAAAPAPASKNNSQTCPSCSAVVQPGDIICIVCGTNLLTGQKIADAPDPAASGGRVTTQNILWGIAAAVAVVLLGIWVYIISSDPVERARELIADLNYPEAQELLEDYIQENPDDEEAVFELGNLQWRTKSYSAAAASFQNVVDINPGNVDAGLYAVLSLQLSGTSSSLSREISILETIAESAQDNAKVWHLLAMAKGARGEAGDYADQREALQRVLSLSPMTASVHLSLGIGQALDGNHPEAQLELNRVSSPEQRGNALAFLGYIAGEENRDSRAMDLFEQALATDGLSVRWQAQTELAKLRIQAGQFREAEAVLTQALSENPDNDLGRYLRGLALHSMGRANEALNEYDTVAKGGGEYSAVAAVQAASIQLLLGDPETAGRTLNIARRAKVETPAYYTVSGRVANSNGLTADARSAFDSAVRMDSSYAPAYLERGLLYVKEDRLDAGLRDLNNYLKLLGRDVTGTKANEIRMLTNQLQRTIETSRRPS